MPEYLAPGVYIEEIERGPQIIVPVPTSTAAFLGETERGPTQPRPVTNWNQYLRIFGDLYHTERYLPYAVRAFFENGGSRCYVARIVAAGASPATVTLQNITITATGPGSAGNRIRVRIGPGTTLDGANQPIGFRLQIFCYGADEQVPTANQFPADMNQFPDRSLMPDLPYEDFNDLSLDRASPNYWDKRVNHGNSSFVEIQVPGNAQRPTSVAAGELAGGRDGPAPGQDPGPDRNAFRGENVDPTQRRGLAALLLDPYREVSLVYAPSGRGVTDATILDIISHCENNRFRFAVIDCERGQANADATNLQPRSRNDTSYAAFYYPWIRINDPRTDARILVPPGGYMCGIYARSDNTRGVWKAPANEPVRGALELEYDIDQRTQEVLNPRGVNLIRRFPDRGIRIWGARTLSSNPLWRYVNVRRLIIFLEASIYNSTQWVVFEPNDNRLWARVRQTVILFLRTQWREGALFGAREQDAFSVAIGLGETMTEDDVNSGRLIIEVGVRPVYPAEFVIFRIFQQTQTQSRS